MAKDTTTYCHACGKGPFENDEKLWNEHISSSQTCLEKYGRQKSIKKQKELLMLTAIPPKSEFFLDQYGNTFARIQSNDHLEIHPLRSREFRRILIGWLQEKGEQIGAESISNLRDICEGKAYLSHMKYELYIRCARSGDDIWLDLCNDEWQAVRITSNGWEIVNEPPVLFRRYNHMREIRVTKGTKEDFLRWIATFNLTGEEQRQLIAVYIGTSLIPGIEHPILTPVGPQGAAKSGMGKAIRRMIDNSVIPALALPKDKNEFAQQLSHHYMPVYDNCSSLAKWQSDLLCRAVTGEGISKRQLYTDDDDVIYQYMRCIQLNGINAPATFPDLLDRSILCRLERIPECERKRTRVIVKLQDELAPAALGYLLDCVVIALNRLGEVPDDYHPRMADFAYHGEAISRAMGYPNESFTTVYFRSVKELSQEAIAGEPIGNLIVILMADKEEWKGTPSELLKALTDLATAKQINTRERGFPTVANALTMKLNILEASLMDIGITYLKKHTGNARQITLTKTGKTVSIVKPLDHDGKPSNDAPPLNDNGTVSESPPPVPNAPETVSEVDTVSKNHDGTNDTNATNDVARTTLAVGEKHGQSE